jgi:hypothetical protein
VCGAVLHIAAHNPGNDVVAVNIAFALVEIAGEVVDGVKQRFNRITIALAERAGVDVATIVRSNARSAGAARAIRGGVGGRSTGRNRGFDVAVSPLMGVAGLPPINVILVCKLGVASSQNGELNEKLPSKSVSIFFGVCRCAHVTLFHNHKKENDYSVRCNVSVVCLVRPAA